MMGYSHKNHELHEKQRDREPRERLGLDAGIGPNLPPWKDPYCLLTKRVHIHYYYGIRPQKTIGDGLLGPNSIMVVYMDPLG